MRPTFTRQFPFVTTVERATMAKSYTLGTELVKDAYALRAPERLAALDRLQKEEVVVVDRKSTV